MQWACTSCGAKNPADFSACYQCDAPAPPLVEDDYRVCLRCQKTVLARGRATCTNCNAYFSEQDREVEALAALAAEQQPVLVRNYKGSQQAEAARQFNIEAAVLAVHGYTPTSQSWAPGQWGAGMFLLAFLLLFVLFGIFIFIYMVIVKPQGTLTVTYTLTAGGNHGHGG